MDRRKLEVLFRQHYGQMYRLATILLHDDAESKDVVHDIFAQLLDDSRNLREETAETYLLTCVRNRCLNVIRDRQIQERVGRLYLHDLDTTIPPSDRLNEEQKALHKGINLLEPPVCRDIILQHFRDGITFKEIANRLGVSETTVYKHLRRALSQLRTRLQYVFIAILLISGIVCAAVYLIRTASHSNVSPIQEEPVSGLPQQENDTIALPRPVLYDNVPLEQILTDLAAKYQLQVVFRDDAVRQLRLFYQWKPEYTLGKVVEMLNNFEALNLQLKGDTVFVSSNTQRP